MTAAAFDVSLPEKPTSCVVFASPHSGRDYSNAFMRRTVLSKHAIRSSEDAFVDLLFDSAPQAGAAFIKARMPRAYVDLNRARTELDPALIEGIPRQGHNPRVSSGLGVIPRVVANGRAIYRGKLTQQEAEARLLAYWEPYHCELQSLLMHAHNRHGQSVLIDCHSMPHEALGSVVRTGARQPNVVLGDRFGMTASGDVVDRIENAFVSAGFVVTRNAPFAGAYITQAYGNPAKSHHAVQVEIDRSIYMDEQRVTPNEHFQDVKNALADVIVELANIGKQRRPLAAE